MAITSNQDFVPEDQWPSVSVMLDGFGQQTLPPSSALAGTSLAVPLASGATVEYRFHDENSLTWKAQGGEGSATYKAIEARPDIFIIDFVRGEGLDAENVTVILDRNTGAVTDSVSRLVDISGKVRAVTEFNHANIAGGEVKHERSDEMVGKRIFYRYSDIETYEHIYLNLGTFTWHCLRGGEAGLADTEQCKTFKVAEDLYIFFWTEKVMTVEAVLLVDLKEQRSIGRMFGWDSKLNTTLVLPFNSRLSVLNTTIYPEDVAKG
ncbi:MULTISPECIES: MoaF C-terminal domain-containing protein [unclassified Salinicola]|uniref:MoaF C-terminal domain-containing protein n=1 Tax=unclassified Salinicola TaxID=2634022 RepID=UPI001A8C1813|nr:MULTISPECIES: MoaF C-terminal domain-containing protein [unclassified Salinicola]MCE3028883.1 molybdenum cofactor biosynthesis F family protein [Salinicola sp. DM10]WIX34405.1 MoaF C-terminal domain-containing protein [Salinicola sp. JS01]